VIAVSPFAGFPGLRVGHVTDAEAGTGCTVAVCDDGAVAGVSVRGFAPGTRETDAVSPRNLVQRVHAILLAGGSAFGLAAADGVVQWLAERGIGFDTSVARVPIVPAAVLFDLGVGRADVRPTARDGAAACAAASAGVVQEGSVGAGTGATVGKVPGSRFAMKAGIGACMTRLGAGCSVGAVVAVNACGDVVDERGGILAGARDPDTGRFLDSAAWLRNRGTVGGFPGNTVLAIVATDAGLDKLGCTRTAEMAHHGIAASVSPSHLSVDGDTIFALSTGERKVSVDVVAAAAPLLVSAAIRRAVRAARGLHGIRGIADAPRD
jgi:L-aminopeptidase/D-esterase-like protein